jgi:hypothetical protein
MKQTLYILDIRIYVTSTDKTATLSSLKINVFRGILIHCKAAVEEVLKGRHDTAPQIGKK